MLVQHHFDSIDTRFATLRVASIPDNYVSLTELSESLISQRYYAELLAIEESDDSMLYYIVVSYLTDYHFGHPDMTKARASKVITYRFVTLKDAREMLFALLNFDE